VVGNEAVYIFVFGRRGECSTVSSSREEQRNGVPAGFLSYAGSTDDGKHPEHPTNTSGGSHVLAATEECRT
jgi:hypothetical protein